MKSVYIIYTMKKKKIKCWQHQFFTVIRLTEHNYKNIQMKKNLLHKNMMECNLKQLQMIYMN